MRALLKRLEVLEARILPETHIVACFTQAEYWEELQRAEKRDEDTAIIRVTFVDSEENLDRDATGKLWEVIWE